MNLIQSNIDCFKKEIQCLVILLASREQVLQSLIALKVAKTIYPQLEIHCLVTEINSEILKSIEWIHSVYVLDKKKYLKSNKLNEKLIEEFKIWIHSIMKSWDILINWSYSHSSCYLAGIIPANLKLGYFSKKKFKAEYTGWLESLYFKYYEK